MPIIPGLKILSSIQPSFILSATVPVETAPASKIGLSSIAAAAGANGNKYLLLSNLSQMINVREFFGEIDIYLFDQILKNQFDSRMSILDAGCGGGRNLIFFLRSGCQVYGVDSNPEAIEYIRELAQSIAPQLSAGNFQVARVEAMPYSDEYFEAVISNAVLHFAETEPHFNRMLDEMWRVLKPGGLLFVRLASSIGIEDKIEPLENRRCLLPDGSERFLVDENLLLEATARIGGYLSEPLKTTNVQNLRSMTTWVLRKFDDQTFALLPDR